MHRHDGLARMGWPRRETPRALLAACAFAAISGLSLAACSGSASGGTSSGNTAPAAAAGVADAPDAAARAVLPLDVPPDALPLHAARLSPDIAAKAHAASKAGLRRAALPVGDAPRPAVPVLAGSALACGVSRRGQPILARPS